MATTDDPPKLDRRRTLAWIARATQVRLRFLGALAVATLVVGRWDVLRTHWDRWTAPTARDSAMGAVSSDTEYFCPMDPGVRSDWPGKCPICQMATVRRTKGDMGPLPSGVVARVQLSPERVQLAGLRSEPVRYRPLAREVRSVGLLSFEGDRASIRAEVGPEAAAGLKPGQLAEVVPDPPDGSAPISGKVRAVEGTAVVVAVGDVPPPLRRSRFASVAIRLPIADREPFRSMPRGDPALNPGEPRAVFACPDHTDVLRLEAGKCPRDEKTLERSGLARNQRVGWWCPMHPKVVADLPGSACAECGGMILVPRVLSHAPIGEVLAIPESAVIDTGSKTMAYVERMPGVFDGVEVRLGPRCGGFYPVVEGLEAGQSVATSGAFLVDAETRLNPALAAGYFGAGAGRVEEPKLAPTPKPGPDGLSGLSATDRALAAAQATCPVTGKRLGSMGTPIKLAVGGRPVFVCCEGCSGPVRDHPEKYLAKWKGAGGAAHHP